MIDVIFINFCHGNIVRLPLCTDLAPDEEVMRAVIRVLFIDTNLHISEYDLYMDDAESSIQFYAGLLSIQVYTMYAVLCIYWCLKKNWIPVVPILKPICISIG